MKKNLKRIESLKEPIKRASFGDIPTTMVSLYSLISFSFVVSISFAQTTTSYDKSQLSSASSRALESGVSILYGFLEDFNNRYETYIKFMEENSMTYPAILQNYIYQLQTISQDSSLYQALKTKSFPFSDFITMFTKFDWASSIITAQGGSTFYDPEYFLTVDKEVSASSVSSTSSGLSSFSWSSGVTSSISSVSSETTSSSTTESSSQSSTTTGSSTNGVDSLYIPIFSLPFLLAMLI